MADVAIRAVGTPAIVNTISVTPTIPAETQVGDLMVLLAYGRVGGVSASAGWNDITNGYGSAFGCIAGFYRYYQNGDPNPTITFGGAESNIAVIISLYNTISSSPLETVYSNNQFLAPTTPFDVILSSFNTNTNGALALFCWGSMDDNTWVYQSGGATQQVSIDNTLGSDNSFCVATKSMPTAGAVGNQVSRQTNKAGDNGARLWFAIKAAPSGASYNESVALAGAAGQEGSRNLQLFQNVPLAGAAAVGEGSGGSSLYPALSVPATAALSSVNIVPADRSLSLPASAGLPVAARAGIPVSALFSGNAGLGQAATLALIGARVLGATAGLSLAAVLSIQSSMSLGGSAVLGEGSGGSSLSPTLNIPATGILNGAGIVNIVRSLGLAGIAGLPAATLINLLASVSFPGNTALTEQAELAILTSLNLPGSTALDLIAVLLAERALTLAGNSTLNAEGTVTGAPSQYSETIDLSALAAIVKSTLMEILAFQSLTGTGGINVDSIIQATVETLFSTTGALTPIHILSRLGMVQFDGSTALDLVATLLAEQALTLAGIGALNADGEVTSGAQQYYETLNLEAVAAAVKTALLTILASRSLDSTGALTPDYILNRLGTAQFDGIGGISAVGIIQATAGALLSGTAALTPNSILAQLGSIQFDGIATLTPAHILGRLGAVALEGSAGVSLGTLLQAVNGLLLTGATALTPAALNAALGLLSLAVTTSLTTTGGFEGFKEISLAAASALTATLIYEMGAPLGLACLASLTLQSSLTGSNLISLAATGQMQELAQLVLTQVVALAGSAGQAAAGMLERSGAVSLPVMGGLAAAAELGLMQSCSLAGIASLATARQLDCAGFLLLESVSAFAPFFGPRVVRGYRLELVLDELELNLKLN
ncbi:MAG: hypothetical protein ABIG94_10140 [Pseudomonadota bacterium]